MRAGLPVAILFHAAIFGVGYVAWPTAVRPLQDDVVIVPIELVEIDTTTNLRPPAPEPESTPEPTPVEETPPEPEPEPDPEPEPEPEAEEIIPEDTAEDEAPEPVNTPEPEPEPTPDPEPTDVKPPEPQQTPKADPTPKPRDNSMFNDILKNSNQKKEERKRNVKTAPDLAKVEDANRPKRSAGDRQRDTATWDAMLKSKLETTGCYRDPDDMANVERLQVTYEITFKRDGTLMRPPKRIRPLFIPPSDQQLRIFDLNAQRAIEKCVPYSDIFPPEHYEEWKDFKFNFGK